MSANTKTVHTDDSSINAETQKSGDNVQMFRRHCIIAMMYYPMKLNKLFGGNEVSYLLWSIRKGINQLDYAYKIKREL